MRSILVLVSSLAVAGCGIHANAQEGGGAETARRTFNVGAFDSIALAGSHDVKVAVGAATSVRAEGDSESLDRLDIRIEGGTLKIGTRKGADWGGEFLSNRKPVTVYVTTPSLAAAAVAGSGDLVIDKVEGERFTGALAGSGDLQIAALRVKEAELTLAGSGDIRAAGSAGRLKASLAGSGDLHLDRLSSEQAAISIAGSGDIRARASTRADVSVMGSGNVTMAGGGQCSVSKRGSGDVTCS